MRNEKSMRSRDNVSEFKDSKIIFSFGQKVWESAGSVLNKLFCLAFSLFSIKVENNFPPLFLTKSPPFLFLPLFPLIFQVFFFGKNLAPEPFRPEIPFLEEEELQIVESAEGG